MAEERNHYQIARKDDGYYDDVRPVDEGHEFDGVDKELIKKIAIIIGVLFVVIIACVALMYVL